MVMPVLLAMALASSASHCTTGTEDEPPLCPLKLPPIARVTIEKNGATNWKDLQGPSCRAFKLDEAQIRRYYARAHATPEESADATLVRSGCAVKGKLTFRDGKSAEFEIERAGAGTLLWPNRKTLTFCPDCVEKPFLP